MCRYGNLSPEDASETIQGTSWIPTTVYISRRKMSRLIGVQSEVIAESVFSCYITYFLLHFLVHLLAFFLHFYLTIDASYNKVIM
jgi:hypothetical protein